MEGKMGEIGDKPKRIEVIPETTPVRKPAPTPTPAPAKPVKEPVPAR